MKIRRNAVKVVLTVVLLMVCGACCFARQVSFQGRVTDYDSGVELHGSEIEVYSLRGDSLVNKFKNTAVYNFGGIENKRSIFFVRLSYPEFHGDTIRLVASYAGFDTTYMDVPVYFGRREAERVLSPIVMHRTPRQLDEVVATASKVKFYFRGDTLVYNADAFVLPDGSMLDALINQLPGVELKPDGQIFVYGKKVDDILLNGNGLMTSDRRLLLDNLGAYTVKEINVYDKKGELSNFLGYNLPDDKQFVLDVKLKKEYSRSTIINLEAAYGTDNRYLGRVFAMHFGNRDRYTFYNNTNNLNSIETPGQSTSWRHDNSGSGRNTNSKTGFDYYVKDSATGDLWNIEGDVNGDFGKQNQTSITDRQNFLSGGDTFERIEEITRSKSRSISTNHSFSYSWKYMRLSVKPRFDLSTGRSRLAAGGAVSRNEDGTDLINTMKTVNASYRRNTLWGVNALAIVKFARIPDYITIKGNIRRSTDRTDIDRSYDIDYADEAASQTERQRFSNRPDNDLVGNISATYSYVSSMSGGIVSGLMMNFKYGFTYSRIHKRSDMFRLQRVADATGNEFLHEVYEEIPDIGNSYRSLELKRSHDVSFFLFKNLGKCELHLSLPVGFVGQTLNYRRGIKPFRIERNSLAIDDSRLFLQYQSDGAINSFEYNVATSLPSLTSMVTITDDTDPLNIYEGNPDLRNAYRHQFTYRLNTSGFKHSLTLIGSFTTDQIVNGYMYDNSTGIRRYKTFNINGDWDVAVNYSKGEMNFGLGKGFFMGITTATEVKFHNAVDMIGDAGDSPRKSDVRNFTVNENFKINWFCPSPRSLLSLLVNATWRNSTSPDHRGFRPINAAELNYGLNYVVNLPANFQISTDFGAYTRIGYGSKELDKTDLAWNARVSCTLGKGKWLIALDGFDLLNQLRNVSYSVNPQGRVEVRTNTLPRYALLHVQYRLNLLPKKR